MLNSRRFWIVFFLFYHLVGVFFLLRWVIDTGLDFNLLILLFSIFFLIGPFLLIALAGQLGAILGATGQLSVGDSDLVRTYKTKEKAKYRALDEKVKTWT
jgi:hypothetical protein